jgi:hypothetical protein
MEWKLDLLKNSFLVEKIEFFEKLAFQPIDAV